MKITILLVIISTASLFSQNFNLNSVFKKIESAKNISDKSKDAINGPNIIMLKDESTTMEFYFRKDESYCGLSREKTKSFNLQLKGNDNSLFSFVDKMKCVTESGQQYQNNSDMWSYKDAGLWSMLFFIEENNGLICFVREYSDGIRKLLPEIKKEYSGEKYFVRADTVYRKIYKTNLDLKSAIKGDIGEAYLLISNNKITDLTENKELCEYVGKNNYEIALLWFSLRFKTHEMAMSRDVLKKLGEIKFKENQTELQAKFLKETKKCYYCNKSYAGESFDYGPFPSYKKELGPCSAKVEVVYKPRFCSRECAKYNCQNKK